MAIKFEVPGKERKKLVSAIAEWNDSEVKYLGAPTFVYTVGDCLTIDKDGNLENKAMDESTFERLVQHLTEIGFECDMSTVSDEHEQENLTYLDISVPDSSLTDAELEKLMTIVNSKCQLISQAFGCNKVIIVKLSNEIHFPWFNLDSSLEESQAYLLFIEKLIAMAKNTKWVTAKGRGTDNAKYDFRCFLLRLGFIGAEYKAARRILLKNLSGNSAFKECKGEGTCSE